MSSFGGAAAPPPGARRTELVTVNEAASTLRVSKSTVYRLIRSGELPALQVGRAFRIPRRALAQYVSAAIRGGDGEAGPG